MKAVLLTLLIVPGLVVVYAFFVRPALEGVPALKKFYVEANGFWSTVWALCGKSITIAFHYGIIGVGLAVQAIDPVASALGDPDLKGQITGYLQANPKALGYFLMAVSILTILSRLRTIGKTA